MSLLYRKKLFLVFSFQKGFFSFELDNSGILKEKPIERKMFMFFEEEPIHVEKAKFQQWKVADLKIGQPYDIVEKIEDGIVHIGEIECQITRTNSTDVSLSFSLSGSAKYWGGLFTLQELIKAFNEVLQHHHIAVDIMDTQDPNFMILQYTHHIQHADNLAFSLQKGEELYKELEKEAYQLLIAKAQKLINEQ